MQSAFRFVAPPSQCGYLPDQQWSLEYEGVQSLTPAEYFARMNQGWRRFGYTIFRPQCPACKACRSLRVDVRWFRPNRIQRRVLQRNQGAVRLQIGPPSVSRAKLVLYDRYHAFQAEAKGWPWHQPRDAASYAESFVHHPFPTQEWCDYLDQQLVAVSYVDDVPGGLSAIYCYYDPDLRDRSLGIWNVLSILAHAVERNIPHVYLGYYVEGCPSMEYKARFVPNQILGPDGQWREYRK